MQPLEVLKYSTKHLIDSLQHYTLDVFIPMLSARYARPPSESSLDFAQNPGFDWYGKQTGCEVTIYARRTLRARGFPHEVSSCGDGGEAGTMGWHYAFL